jgi:alginate O-acetyltransferase complex protein AlgI
MVFTQLIFVLFFVVVLAFLYCVRHHRARKLFLLAASYYFYAYWDWRFSGLLLLTTVIDFWIGRQMAAASTQRTRLAYLIGSLVSNLGVLAFFKYCNFFVDSLQALLAPLGSNFHTLNILLPIGISFYTFQSMSYTIDVYRKQLKPCNDFWDFALFISFFPQLVAGPIVRASDFLPQLEKNPALTKDGFYLGFLQFMLGMVKKALIADHLGMVADFTFANLGVFDGWTTWIGVLCYAGQIYCDFSGYSDMAIGCARIMGYDLCVNFDHPYAATSITAFWHKWHISLSTWLRDYLYIPLGGNRKGPARTYVNLMLTMTLGGLWHGAAWTFVVWGVIHGMALAVDKKLRIYQRVEAAGLPVKMMGWAYTMLVVLVGWVFFRSQSFADAWTCLHAMFDVAHFNQGIHWISTRALVCLPLVVGGHLMSTTRWKTLVELPAERWYAPTTMCFMIWMVVLFRPMVFSPFVYFQF